MDKSEFKASVVHELGCKIDDMSEAAKLEIARNEGAKTALILASKKVSELNLNIDKDVDDGLVSLETATLIKKYVIRAVSILESGAVSAENYRLISQGKFQALEMVVGNLKKIHSAELEKSQARKDIDESDESRGRNRVSGVGPSPSIKNKRLAEEAAEVDTPVVKPFTTKKSVTKKSTKKKN